MSTIKQELLRRAAKLVGIENLAIALKAPLPLLEAWMNGKASMPDRKLTVLADYLDEISQPTSK